MNETIHSQISSRLLRWIFFYLKMYLIQVIKTTILNYLTHCIIIYIINKLFRHFEIFLTIVLWTIKHPTKYLTNFQLIYLLNISHETFSFNSLTKNIYKYKNVSETCFLFFCILFLFCLDIIFYMKLLMFDTCENKRCEINPINHVESCSEFPIILNICLISLASKITNKWVKYDPQVNTKFIRTKGKYISLRFTVRPVCNLIFESNDKSLVLFKPIISLAFSKNSCDKII